MLFTSSSFPIGLSTALFVSIFFLHFSFHLWFLFSLHYFSVGRIPLRFAPRRYFHHGAWTHPTHPPPVPHLLRYLSGLPHCPHTSGTSLPARFTTGRHHLSSPPLHFQHPTLLRTQPSSYLQLHIFCASQSALDRLNPCRVARYSLPPRRIPRRIPRRPLASSSAKTHCPAPIDTNPPVPNLRASLLALQAHECRAFKVTAGSRTALRRCSSPTRAAPTGRLHLSTAPAHRAATCFCLHVADPDTLS